MRLARSDISSFVQITRIAANGDLVIWSLRDKGKRQTKRSEKRREKNATGNASDSGQECKRTGRGCDTISEIIHHSVRTNIGRHLRPDTRGSRLRNAYAHGWYIFLPFFFPSTFLHFFRRATKCRTIVSVSLCSSFSLSFNPLFDSVSLPISLAGDSRARARDALPRRPKSQRARIRRFLDY